MTLKRTGGIILALALALCSGAARAQKDLYCEGKGSTTIGKDTQASTMKAWMKGSDKFRMEEAGKDRTIITIVNGKHIWVLSKKLKKGVHRERTPQEIQAAQGRRALGNDILGFRKEGARPIRKEKVDGVTCDFYEIKRGNALHKIWVLPGPEQLTKKRQSFGTAMLPPKPGAPPQKYEVSRQISFDWKFDMPIPDSLFTPPAGYKIEDARAAPPGSSPPTGKRP